MVPCCCFCSTYLNFCKVSSQYGVSPTITVASEVAIPTATSLTDADVQTILKNKVSSGAITIDSGSRNYASVHLGRAYSGFTNTGGRLCNTGVGCSYHSSVSVTRNGVTSTLYYAVIPNLINPIFECANNCGPLDNPGNQHAVMLHELAEAVTNPFNSGGWVASFNSSVEVADLVSFPLSFIFHPINYLF